VVHIPRVGAVPRADEQERECTLADVLVTSRSTANHRTMTRMEEFGNAGGSKRCDNLLTLVAKRKE